jgi:hypothetical protein
MKAPLDGPRWLARIGPVLNLSATNHNCSLVRFPISPRANNPVARECDVLNL